MLDEIMDIVSLHMEDVAEKPERLERAVQLVRERVEEVITLKAMCERLEAMGYVVVGRNEWERVIPEFRAAFPAHFQRSPSE